MLFEFQCSVGEAVRVEIDYLSKGEPKIMLIGPGCSKSAQPIAESVHYWNVVQVSNLYSREFKLVAEKPSAPLH